MVIDDGIGMGQHKGLAPIGSINSRNYPFLGQKHNVVVYSLQMRGNRRIYWTQQVLPPCLNLRAKGISKKHSHSPCRKPDSVTWFYKSIYKLASFCEAGFWEHILVYSCFKFTLDNEFVSLPCYLNLQQHLVGLLWGLSIMWTPLNSRQS